MSLNFEHKDNIELYVKDNIDEINNRISDFKLTKVEQYGVKIDETDIKNYLKSKLHNELSGMKEILMIELANENYRKSAINGIANKYVYYKTDLENFYRTELLKKLELNIPDSISQDLVETIKSKANLELKEFEFIKTDLTKITKKSLDLIVRNGYLVNINNVESGVMTANAGDSAQMLFVGRAILAGFNTSNVDVRASRYDSIVDYKGRLFKIQVKGISGTTISFKDRDRGGRGIDTHNPRNIGKRITSKDCDVYVAVDKQIGTCYLIPMIDIDPWSDDDIKSVNIDALKEYKENWDVFERLSNKKQ